uniref:Uncharacterized protein n=1 Tax=Triticum urartu TaxID=4572 RepID=A0A8R7QBQ1_TRIUA
MSMSLLPHATVFLFIFLVAAPSQVHARVAPDDRHTHGGQGSSNTDIAKGDAPVTLTPAYAPANDGAGRGRTLWSTPSDGVGH